MLLAEIIPASSYEDASGHSHQGASSSRRRISHANCITRVDRAPSVWIRPKLELLRLVTGLPFTNQLTRVEGIDARLDLALGAQRELPHQREIDGLPPGRSTRCVPRFRTCRPPAARKAFALSQLLLVPSPYGLSSTWSGRCVVVWMPENARFERRS
jgi:hypothetical protein